MKETVFIFQELFVAITFERYQSIINLKYNMTLYAKEIKDTMLVGSDKG